MPVAYNYNSPPIHFLINNRTDPISQRFEVGPASPAHDNFRLS